jgi:hypothetical protein
LLLGDMRFQPIDQHLGIGGWRWHGQQLLDVGLPRRLEHALQNLDLID